ncbi:MAG: sigma-70 family RNA polymerase sigma factor [Candidatus Binataceae bacterium]
MNDPLTDEALYEEHHRRIGRLCLMLLGNPEEARDVAQEVFLKMVQQRRDAVPPRDWRAWLTRVAINACHDRRRSGWWKWWRRDGRELLDADLIAHGPEDEAVRTQQRIAIWRGLRALTKTQRDVFILRQIEGWPVRATAEALNLSADSVKLHLFRAMRRMRKALWSDR